MGKLYPVEQRHRDAAASGYFAWVSSNSVIPSKMLSGKADDHSMVQSFARFEAEHLTRIAATPAVDREGVREAVARKLCEQHGGDPDAVAREEHDCWDGPLWTVFLKDADAIMALHPVKQSDGWKDISTAPKDRCLLGYWMLDEKRSHIDRIWWDHQFEQVDWDEREDEPTYRGAWTAGRVQSWGMEEIREEHPTHWQPLPAPPAKQSDDRTIEHSSIVAERVKDGLEQIATASEDTEASVLRYIAKATLDALPPAIRSLDITRMEAPTKDPTDE